jgi:fumarate hydratase class II
VVTAGRPDDHFPPAVWQTGPGTRSDMNGNEVTHNQAAQVVGGGLGGKSPIRPTRVGAGPRPWRGSLA